VFDCGYKSRRVSKRVFRWTGSAWATTLAASRAGLPGNPQASPAAASQGLAVNETATANSPSGDKRTPI